MDIRFVLSLLFAIIVAVFAIQNAGVVNFDLFMWSFSVSQALVILISAVCGAIAVMLLGIIRWVRLNSKIRSSAKTIVALEEENKQLKQKLECVPQKMADSDENKPSQDSVQSQD